MNSFEMRCLASRSQEDCGASKRSPATSNSPRVLLLGLGNDLLCDDAIGLRIAAEVSERVANSESVSVAETAEMGLALLDLIIGFDALIIVDAVQTRQAPPGFLFEIDEDNLSVLPGTSPHFLGLGEALALGRELGLAIPARVKILAVEVVDPFAVSAELSPAVQHALPRLVERVTSALVELAASRAA